MNKMDYYRGDKIRTINKNKKVITIKAKHAIIIINI